MIIDVKWKNTILINTTDYRWCHTIDFNLLNNMYHGNLIFISSDIKQYNIFTKNTLLNIDFYKPNNFSDLCIAIKSCKLFVGSFSAPLTIANAFNKDRIAGMCGGINDDKMNSDLNIIWNNIRYSV